MPHVTFGAHKKQCFGPAPQRPNASKIRAKKKTMPWSGSTTPKRRGFRTMAAQSLVSVRFEKTETPARFEPMPSKKRADRMLHVTFGTHKEQSLGSETPERQQQSSLCQAKNRSKRGFRTMAAPSLVSVRFEKTETQRQQQSSLCQAKNRSKRGFRTMAAPSLVSVRFEKTETPARFEPMPSKKHADRMLHVTFGTHKKHKASVPKHPNASSSRASAKQKTVRNAHITTSRNVDSERWWLLKVSSASDSKRPKHQQDSSPCQAKNTQTECFTSPLEPIRKTKLRFRNTRTPAAVKPLPSKKPFETWIPNDGCSKSRLRQIRKDRNTSKIRAHAKQKTRRQNASRHLWNP